MNLVIAVLWTVGAAFWAVGNNPWLAALYALNAGLFWGITIAKGING